MTTITAAITETAELLQAGRDDDYSVNITPQGWIDVRNNPARQLDPAAKLDFLRLVNDDGMWRVIHLTHNEVIKGEATFSNSMAGMLFVAVRDFFESL